MLQDVTELKQAEEQLERRARQLGALGRLGQAVAGTLDTTTVLNRVLDHVAPLLAAEGLTILMLEGVESVGQERTLFVAAARGELVMGMEGSRFAASKGIAREVIASKRPVWVQDAANREHLFRRVEQRHGITIRSLLAAPLELQGQIIGVMEAVHSRPNAFDADQQQLLTAACAWTAIAIGNARLYGEVKTGREQLRWLTQQAVTALEEERQRVSRELHDEAGQALTALKIGLALLRDDLPPEMELIRQRVGEATELTGATMDHIRQLAHTLRPPALDTIGLNSTLEGYCREFAARTRLTIDYKGQELPALPEAINITYYRLLQEALTNVARHSQATAAQVSLTYDGATLTLRVTDNGRGFDLASMPDQAGSPAGIGLVGMRERLQLLGGRVDILSEPGQGTHIIGSAPWRVDD
jgi:signal transduction histidine kinase